MIKITRGKSECYFSSFASATDPYSPLPERPRLSLRTINLIQSGMPVKKCISGEKSDIVLSNHNYGRRQIKAKWNNEEFGYFNTITKIANAILCSLFMFWL